MLGILVAAMKMVVLFAGGLELNAIVISPVISLTIAAKTSLKSDA
jgi:hypothetical protein